MKLLVIIAMLFGSAVAEETVDEMRTKIAAHDELGRASERVLQARIALDQEIEVYKEMRAKFPGDVSKDIAQTVRAADKLAGMSAEGAVKNNAVQRERAAEFDARAAQKDANEAFAASDTKYNNAKAKIIFLRNRIRDAESTLERLQNNPPQMPAGTGVSAGGSSLVYDNREAIADHNAKCAAARESIQKFRHELNDAEQSLAQLSDEHANAIAIKSEADKSIAAVLPPKAVALKVTIYKLLDGRTIESVSHVDAGDDVLLKTKDGKIERIKKDQIGEIH